MIQTMLYVYTSSMYHTVLIGVTSSTTHRHARAHATAPPHPSLWRRTDVLHVSPYPCVGLDGNHPLVVVHTFGLPPRRMLTLAGTHSLSQYVSSFASFITIPLGY